MHRMGENFLAKRALEPKSWGVAANAGDVLTLTGYDRVLYVLHSGANGLSATVDVKVQQCATSGGTYADITGAVFVQITEANDQAIYLLDIPVYAGYDYQKVIATVATAASILGIVAIPYKGDQVPVTQDKTVVYLPA